MNATELQKEMAMTYDELTAYLQNKYGKPSRAYFCTNECKTKSPITRTDEGLFIHHIKETEVDNLQDKNQAKANPWEYQESDNLCYCNYLEHLILHIKINIMRSAQADALAFDGVINHIVPDLNYIYLDNPVETAKNRLWRNKVKEIIIDNYNEYQEILQIWVDAVKNYTWGNMLSVNKLLSWRGYSIPKPTLYEAINDFRKHCLRRG